MLQSPISLTELFAGARSCPSYAQVFVHYDPREQPISKIVELIENFEGELSSLEILASSRSGLKIAHFKLENQDASHIVIALIENLRLEAYGCGPLTSTA